VAVWLVRAGSQGENEQLALDEKIVVIGWSQLPDLKTIESRDELKELLSRKFPDSKVMRIANWTGQLWAFRSRIQEGDLVVLPFKKTSAIAIGRVVGDYQYRADLAARDACHTRPVEWIRDDIPRSAFDADILYSFGAFLTVCQISRNDAEERIRAFLSGSAPMSHVEITAEEVYEAVEEQAPPDLAQHARDLIQTHISRKFRGHDLARLVTALLEAQGYVTETSPPGVDGGVDVIAGKGPMGFDPPRIAVQVKSSDNPVDVGVLRELQGVLKGFGAEHGLLVSWGGFKQSVIRDARKLFFEIRLWDAGDIVDALMESYEELPADLQAEIPLKRIWTLVPNDE
jgi:restriction system protein